MRRVTTQGGGITTRRPILCVTLGVVFIAAASTAAPAGESHPYDLSAIDALLAAEASSLSGHYAIIVRQDGTEIYRAQLGDIGFDTKLGMASLTKTDLSSRYLHF